MKPTEIMKEEHRVEEQEIGPGKHREFHEMLEGLARIHLQRKV